MYEEGVVFVDAQTVVDANVDGSLLAGRRIFYSGDAVMAIVAEGHGGEEDEAHRSEGLEFCCVL